MPPTEFPDLIVVHPQFGFCFFEALFNGPAQAAEPNKEVQSSAGGSIAGKVGILQLVVDMTAPDYKPDYFARQTILTQGDALFGEFIADGPLSALRNCALVPVEIAQRLGEV
jgi:hypothetical protein